MLAVTLRYPPYAGGGYELLARDAVEGLRARGHAALVLCGGGRRFAGDADVRAWLAPEQDGAQDLFQRSFKASNAERFRLHFLRLKNYRATLRALDLFEPDVLLFFNLSHASLGPVLAARHAGVPTLGYVADPWPENHWVRAWRADARARAKPQRLRLLEQTWSAFRGLVGLGPLQACSAWMRAALIEDGILPESVDVLHLGVSPALAARAAASPPAQRGAGEPLRVVCTSMLWEGKGQHVLLKAAARARAAGVALELDLAGAGEPSYAAYLRELADAPELAGAVRFHGLLDAAGVSALLARAHVFALPSVWPEPFGLSTAEAMAHGVAALGSDSGATPELIEDGVTGLLAAAGDPEEWYLALRRLEADEGERGRLAAAGRAHAQRAFDHGRFIDGLERGLAVAAEAGA